MADIWLLSFLLLGAFVGVMSGLLGIGGGGIMVPILTSLFLMKGIGSDSAVHLALGTSMASIIATSLASTRAHNKRGTVLWPIVLQMAGGILIGTFAVTFVAAKVPSFYLAVFFSLFMAYVALTMFRGNTRSSENQPWGIVGLTTAGTGIGAISALVSIGGGSLTVPFLIWQKVEVKKAIGTSAAIGIPISVAGTLGYIVNGWSHTHTTPWTFGFVYLPAVLMIALASFVTAPLGAALAHKLPVPMLKKVFALLLVLLSIKMLFSVLD